MKIKGVISSKKILSLTDNFALLENYDNGINTYKFSYNVDYKEAIRRKAYTVKINILSKKIKKPPGIFNQDSLTNKLDPLLLIKNITQIEAIKKDNQNNNIGLILNSISSDITANIDNTNKTNTTRKKIFQLIPKNILDIKNIKEPILQQPLIKNYNNDKKYQSIAYKSLLYRKEDPSNIIFETNIKTTKSFAGLKPKFKINFRNLFKKDLINDLINVSNIDNSSNISSESLIPVLTSIETRFLEISKIIEFTNEQINNASIISILFELIDNNGVIIETIQQNINHSRNIQIFLSPKKEPSINVISTQSKNILTIQQNDKHATAVKIYRRDVKKTQPLKEQDYVFLKDLDVVQKKGSAIYEDKLPNYSDVIYRIIPVGPQGQIGSVYNNIVVQGKKYDINSELRHPASRHCGIIAESNPRGIKVSVVAIPINIIAIKLLVKDKTINEDSYRVVNSFNDGKSITPTNNTLDIYTFIDNQVKKFHIYEYKCILFTSDGSELIGGAVEYIEYIPYTEGAITTTLDQPLINLTDNGIDVKFSIFSSFKKNDSSLVRDALINQGYDDLYADEILQGKQDLSKLLAYNIRRINLRTGESNYFNTLIGNQFSDLSNRGGLSITSLEQGTQYRYVVSTLLRSQQSVFPDVEVEIENDIGLSVPVRNFNFLHPVSQIFGNIVNSRSLRKNHSKNSFDFGEIGNYVFRDVLIEASPIKIYNVIVKKFNKDINIVSWDITGNKNQIDHFLIIVEFLGSQELIGKVHAVSRQKRIEFYDEVFSSEPHSLKYKIVPIYKDYTQGSAVYSNEVI